MSTETQDIKISGHPTIDPLVCRFEVEYPILPEQTLTCRNKEMAAGSLLLEVLFEIEGIREVMISGSTITVAKDGPEAWPELGKKIGTTVRNAISTKKPLINTQAKKKLPSEEKIRKDITRLFDEEINPAIAAHGGSVELADVEGTAVYLRLGGGCQGCSSANVTLRQGIEKAIKAAIPEVTEIHDITDHASGANPYYT